MTHEKEKTFFIFLILGSYFIFKYKNKIKSQSQMKLWRHVTKKKPS